MLVPLQVLLREPSRALQPTQILMPPLGGLGVVVGTAQKVLSYIELDEEDVLNIVYRGKVFNIGEEAVLGIALDKPLPSIKVEELSKYIQKELGDLESPNLGSSLKVSSNNRLLNLKASTKKVILVVETSTTWGKCCKKYAPLLKIKVYPYVIYMLPTRRTFLKRSAN